MDENGDAIRSWFSFDPSTFSGSGSRWAGYDASRNLDLCGNAGRHDWGEIFHLFGAETWWNMVKHMATHQKKITQIHRTNRTATSILKKCEFLHLFEWYIGPHFMLMNGWKSIRQWFWCEHQGARRMIYNVHCLWYFILLWNVVVWEILHQKLTYPIPLIWNTPQTPGLVFDQIISAVLKVDMSFSLKLMMRFGCRGDVAMFFLSLQSPWIFHLQKPTNFLAICRPLSLETWWMATQRPGDGWFVMRLLCRKNAGRKGQSTMDTNFTSSGTGLISTRICSWQHSFPCVKMMHAWGVHREVKM